jgi:folate-binding protein YgfZ
MKDFLAQNYPDIVFEDNNAKVITDSKEEYLSLRHGVGVRDITDSSFIILRGIDSFDYLSRISTNSVKELAVLHKATVLFTNNKGRVIDKAAVVRITDYCFILGGRGSSSRLKSWLERYIINENIKVEDMTGKYSIFELAGPQVESYMNLVFGDVLESIDESLVIISEINEVKIYIAKFKESNGFIKYWIFGDSNFASVIAQYLLDQKSFFDFNFVGEEAYNVYRVEQGIPVYPNEFKDMFSPHELKLMDHVNLQKGRFIGQDIIAKSDTYNTTQRELTGVSFESKCDIELPAPLYDENNEVAGMLTSTAYSPSLLKQIGLAVIKKKTSAELKQLTVKDKENNMHSLTTTSLPFRK